MAMDGSFSVQSSLERFLDRCPRLQSVSPFNVLIRKGSMLTEDEVVEAVADVFLLHNYTIPLMGCFRPIARKIVDKSVYLLQLVSNLGSNTVDIVAEIEEEKILNDHSVIEFLSRMGRGLDLHELACMAFCRALDMAPFLLGSVLKYFKFAPPPFGRFLMRQKNSKLSGEDWSCGLRAVRMSYRFLLLEPDTFSKLWDWSCLLDLAKQSAYIDVNISTNITDIRWCAAQIISRILKVSDRAAANMGVRDEDAFLCLLRWEEFCQDVALEKAGGYINLFEQDAFGPSDRSFDFDEKSYLQSFGLNDLSVSSSQFHLEPLIKRHKSDTMDREPACSPFVLTSAVKKSFKMALLAVTQKWPVLLYGPSGCGKSSLVNKLAGDFNIKTKLDQDSQIRVLSIHMDDQIDGKTLVGSYVCTEQPGEFRWQPGSLTQAILYGYWVVFEDIDKAPSDVHSILLPLLEGAKSFTTEHGEEIKVAESFRLFSTLSTSKLDLSCITEGGNSFSVFWRKVMVGPPNTEDLQEIVKKKFPSLEPLVEKLIETFQKVNSTLSCQLAGFQTVSSASVNYLDRFSLRDLLKWCKRIAGKKLSLNENDLSAYECHCIYQEVVDVFAAFSTSIENRLILRKEIAKLWAIPATAVDALFPPNKPIIQDLFSGLRIGRVPLQHTQANVCVKRKSFVEIRSSLYLLESIASSVQYNEPVLLVGETGTGKTTLIQDLAMRLGQKLTVLNLSQQSDVADLLGGFKPLDAPSICFPLYKKFEDLFSKTFSLKDNGNFISHLQKLLTHKKWERLLSSLQFVCKSVKDGVFGSSKKRKKPLNEEQIKAWTKFSSKLEEAWQRIASSGMIFSFVEGAFVKALKNGEWILLDEVNLAPPETLQRIIGVLEGENGSLCLAEKGDISYVPRHHNFRLFACMNPATDAGKRDLPFLLRSRFTEYFVDDVLDYEDLTLFVSQFMGDSKSDAVLVSKIVSFYKAAKKDAEERLQDGANQKPQYSLRSLYRALEYTRKAERKFGFQKAVYDGFCMFFHSLLDRPSAEIMQQMIVSSLLGGKIPRDVHYDGYLALSSNSNEFTDKYILTRSVREHLRNLARAIMIKKYPILLQGPTSSGKTSLVQYLAAVTGHEFVRINNHEHTDLQEYLGSYVADAGGKLVFHEGVLVKAARNGCWIVLDELNLAPSDVLEALNRLLDDNRELFVPELQETIRPHPDFMLFATQNPPTFYGGRKMLSRAFRNRFVEIHIDEIPEDELSTIVEQRCKIPASYAKKMVEVMKSLQLNRQRSKIFAGKHGFITPRDLFRWADRFRMLGGSCYEDLARDGYYLLAERLRDENEKRVIQEVLEKHLRVKLLESNLYNLEAVALDSVSKFINGARVLECHQNVIWTKSMQRLFFVVWRCYQVREPVLLVGETGGGKTTVCQLLSVLLGSKLHILNCHQYTETSDFLGGFYPIRDRSKLMLDYENVIGELLVLDALKHFHPDFTISSDISHASSTLSKLEKLIKSYKQGFISYPAVTDRDLETLEVRMKELSQLHQKWQTIFMWQDGPLVQSMKDGDLLLVDEISLADDSVLERLNSVLEPERTLSLAEKGGSDLEKIVAHDKFFLLATMNPGGDFGKKELSPALRNRFTEIWVPPVGDVDELKSIALQRLLSQSLAYIVDPMIRFWEWFSHLQIGRLLTVRDLLSWVDFVNMTERSLGPEYAFLHGAFLILLDGLSLGTGMSKKDAGELRELSLSFLLEQLNVGDEFSKLSKIQNYGWGDLGTHEDVTFSDKMHCDDVFGIDPFYIKTGSENCETRGFEFLAPTTRRNALRALRAMQLQKPILLEGSPGVGKTSLVNAMGQYSGHKVVRINLSEQTDIMDLLGSDLPVETDDGMKFAWSDGILLQALKEGCWVLLDELNLAPQSVLEGLNSILDHRAEVFIPELGCTFKCPLSFRVFACQNPSSQGGGRKGLPKSFLNRFTKVYVDELLEDDYHFICRSLYPSIPRSLLLKLIIFNKRMHEDTMLHHKFAQEGSPWEFNLRDVIRSCEIITGTSDESKSYCFLNIVYVQRMRTEADRRQVLKLYEDIFKVKPYLNPHPCIQVNSRYLTVGKIALKRNFLQSSKTSGSPLKILPGIRQGLEAAAQCVKHQWLCILIGPASSGKSSLISLLAQLTGNILNELHLSSGTDISEILGCFEQYNAFRNFRSVVALVERYIDEYCCFELESSKEAFVSEEESLITKWLGFTSRMNHDFISSFASADMECGTSFVESLHILLDIVQQLKLVIETNVLSLTWSSKELDRAMKTIFKVQEVHQRRSCSAKFEWVTGSLIKAVERGEWIVLENANCCNPTVLDRINSLVESSGSITINECGNVDGKPLLLHPHPNFRLFLTVNPRNGEVSRAMRNRGVEIFLMPPCWLMDESSSYKCEEVEVKDVERFLILSGLPSGKLVHSMAKAHIFARKEGLCCGISITFLELARWVQLFQQFITSGNQPIWSLHTSWEHTYLSSLGEVDGSKIVCQVKQGLLSVAELSQFISSVPSTLCLTGGWPMPLKLRDYVWYSKETSIKQICSYLETLAAQYALFERENASFRTTHRQPYKKCQYFTDGGYVGTYLMDVKMLRKIMFPKAPNMSTSNLGDKFDLAMARSKLFFAANWTIEQATESDLKLYLVWFNWFKSQLQPLPPIFESIHQLMVHPLWEFVSHCYHKYQVDPEKQSVPMLSLDFLNEVAPEDRGFLRNAINCIDLLNQSYQQWNDEIMCYNSEKAQGFLLALKSLRVLEEELFGKLIDSSGINNGYMSQSFDLYFGLYAELLGGHKLFWNDVMSSDAKKLLISWRSLLKMAAKLRVFCPEAADRILKDMMILDEVSSWNCHAKSLLWVYGGHPFLPASASLSNKQLQLLKLCEVIWPTKADAFKADMTGFVASSNSELRFLAVEGVSMLSSITGKFESDTDEALVLRQVEDMSEKLAKRFEHAKENLEKSMGSNQFAVSEGNSSGCCFYPTEILCQKYGFDSWQDILPLIDITSLFLDMELLRELSSSLLVDSKGLKLALNNVSQRLENALKFSLASSSRPPQMFLPHQRLLWILDAWTVMDQVTAKVAGLVVEMWFRWHQSLWICQAPIVQSFSKAEGYDIPVPDMLFQPVMMATVNQILRKRTVIKEFFSRSLELKAASCNLWCSISPGSKFQCFLLSAARCLFEQIIYAHKKAFDGDKFAEINSIFSALHAKMNERDNVKLEDLQLLISLILSSSHDTLKSSVDKFVKPLLGKLYLNYSVSDFISNLGCSWLMLGSLRLSLLFSCDDLDPAMKYHYKYLQLEENISLHKLELQVRQECDYLIGRFSSRDTDRKKIKILENLEVERQKLQRKLVFRPDYVKFKELKYECNEFLERIKSSEFLWSNIKAVDLKQVVNQGCNWQKMASGFIERLSDHYAEYNDFVQPVQVAIYEMKLGLSLVVSSMMQQKILGGAMLDNVDRIMESIRSLMRFPWASVSKTIFVNMESDLPGFPSYELEISPNFCAKDMDILEKLVTFSSDRVIDKDVPVKQLKASLYKNILVRLAHFLANAKLMDSASLKFLDTIFNEFADLWMRTKIHAKTKEDYNSQQYKFRPRAFKIENIIGIDISTICGSAANGTLMEWKEFLSEDEFTAREETCNEIENSEEEEDHMDDSIVNDVVNIHNLLFGSNGFILTQGMSSEFDFDRLLSFADSYMLGIGIIDGLGGLFFSTLDSQLAPEHLLRLCIEHEQFSSFFKSAHRYNIYKDPNAMEMSKMIKLLSPLQWRIHSLLNEHEDHHGLRKISDLIETLLNIPSSSPLAKALSGLHFLLKKAHELQENGAKFFPYDLLEPIISLVVLWQKMEFESWPALLDEVQEQHDVNAGKLWFPLYSILQQSHLSDNDITEYSGSIILSLEEFIHTSSIGQFKKRLELLFAFMCQIHIGRCLKINSSSWQVENMKILYNMFGFFMQMLPTTLEHIETSRQIIEKELKDLLKLCSWERPETLLSIENTKRTRQKLRKLIQKYNDLLEQPLMLFLHQDVQQIPNPHSQRGPEFGSGFVNSNLVMLDAAFNVTLFDDENRFAWFADWRNKADRALKNLQLDIKLEFNDPFSHHKSKISRYLTSQTLYLLHQDKWNDLWFTLGRIFRTTQNCGELWKNAKKSQSKRRALSELLKLLESSGLSRHKPVNMEGEVKSWWFLMPSHNLKHLLLTQTKLSDGGSDFAAPSEFQSPPCQKLFIEWTTANEYYFKSIASVRLLQHACLNCHRDITLEQVERSGSFIHQLIEIQQKQQAAAIGFEKQFVRFRKCVSILERLYQSSDNESCSKFSIINNQDSTIKCMWQQKQLLDNLCTISHDEMLLLRKFENTHLKTCQTVKGAVNGFLTSIEKSLPSLKSSKKLLDGYLLGSRRENAAEVAAAPHLFVASKQMEELVLANFRYIKEYEEHLLTLDEHNVNKTSVIEALLSHFAEVFLKAKLVEEEFTLEREQKNESLVTHDEGTFNQIYTELVAGFLEAYKSAFDHIMETMQSLCTSCNNHLLLDESAGNISSWELLFDSLVTNLSLDQLCEKLLRTIFCAKKLVNEYGHIFHSLRSQIGAYFDHLTLFVDLLLNFSHDLLQEFLTMHKTVSSMTGMLANVLASLYSKGFGISAEEEVGDAPAQSQDASGTGMGEGAGLRDVSDQITDEDQLLEASKKPGEEQDASGEAPSKNDKGIEMEQDFFADTFSVSEDSEGDTDEDGEEDKLDSAMGETGGDGELVDEKMWNKDEDKNSDDMTEKYESGPSVQSRDASSRELRAKEDADAPVDEDGEHNCQELDKFDSEIADQDDHDDGENLEGMNLDKEDANVDSTGSDLGDLDQKAEEDMDIDEKEDLDSLKEGDSEVQPEVSDELNVNENSEEKAGPNDEARAEVETEQQDITSEGDEPGGGREENAERSSMGLTPEVVEAEMGNSTGDGEPNSKSATQVEGKLGASDSMNTSSESNYDHHNDLHDTIVPMQSLHSGNTSEMNLGVSDSSKNGRKTSDQQQNQLPCNEASSIRKNQPNPYRSVGDALKEWKQRAEVSIDLQTDDMAVQDEMKDESAKEFGYVSEFEKGTAQALGPATTEQIDRSLVNNKLDEDKPMVDGDGDNHMEIEKEACETYPIRSDASVPKRKVEDQMHLSELNQLAKEKIQVQNHEDGDLTGLSDSLVSLRKSYLSEDLYQLSKLSVNGNDLGKAKDSCNPSNDSANNATNLWKRYELITTRLSQELAEQLRLVMEPTLASKLQGDYKTGKRINMKKVIPYIASHYRKDKIWLRRTRPNKRDYQVVIAVDDSRSMSESCCGDVAIEALVTVCRAMSQLEMGNLAVASFGKKGNIRLLHDFGQPFTGEAGIKMVSSLTFKQENTIADEPVLDLLKFLNDKLDTAVVRARLPTGQNPLQQLVLIIADGRFHEKESLKRCVRDILSKKRMVAFLLLDNPKESIVDLMEASFEGENIKFSKYMDSFPFPYYIVLRNIDTLPRTLADLLKQWFELMQTQYSRE